MRKAKVGKSPSKQKAADAARQQALERMSADKHKNVFVPVKKSPTKQVVYRPMYRHGHGSSKFHMSLLTPLHMPCLYTCLFTHVYTHVYKQFHAHFFGLIESAPLKQLEHLVKQARHLLTLTASAHLK